MLPRNVIEAGYGLPYLHRLLYYEIASLADLSSGVAGLRRRISMQALRDALWIEPAPGRKDSGPPSRDAIRNALRFLTENGYLVERGPLVFEVAELARGQSVQKKETANRPISYAQETQTPHAVSPTGSNGSGEHFMPIDREPTDNRPLINHTSDVDEEINGGGISVHAVGRLFVERFKFQEIQAFTPKTTAEFRKWIAAGATLELIAGVVEFVNARSKASVIGSPMYYSEEILRACNASESTGARGRARQSTAGVDPLSTWAAPGEPGADS